MKSKVFTNGSNGDNREIFITINDESIEFFYYRDYLRQQEWIQNEIERRLESGEDELTEDETANNGFYWINKADWKNDMTERLDDPSNWINHMNEKNWFTSKMEDFINQNV